MISRPNIPRDLRIMGAFMIFHGFIPGERSSLIKAGLTPGWAAVLWGGSFPDDRFRGLLKPSFVGDRYFTWIRRRVIKMHPNHMHDGSTSSTQVHTYFALEEDAVLSRIACDMIGDSMCLL